MTAALAAGVRSAGARNQTLFIGNSLTGENNLPGMVGQLRLVSGEPNDFFQRAAVTPGVGLDYHWSNTGPQSAHGLLNPGGWNGVVLQDLSFHATDHPERTRTYATLWDAEIKQRAPDATTYLFAHWERLDRPGSIGAINSLYQSLGADLDATVAPVGSAWERLKQDRPDIQLYTDLVHPTRHGSYLGAAVFYSSIYAQSPVGFPPSFAISAADAALLQNIAWDVVSGRQTAVDRAWIGEAGGQWNDPLMWGPSGAPAAGDRVVLAQSDGADRVIEYLSPNGASTLLGSLSINAQSGSIGLRHRQHTLRMAGNLVIGSSSGSGDYQLSDTGRLFVARDERIISGAFVQQGGKNIAIGALMVGEEAGIDASYQLDGGLLDVHVIEVRPGGVFTRTAGRLENDRFELIGGMVRGTLRNRRLFNYSSGRFEGKLLNEGTAMLGSNIGKVATSEAGAGAELEIEVAGEGSSIVIVRANQDLRSLVVRHENAGEQGFDLASGGGGDFRSIRIYPGDEAAIALAERDLAASIRHALSNEADGIFDSSLVNRPQMRIAVGRRIDSHLDNFLLLRPTVIGDLNIDGNVTISDFLDLAANFGAADATWERGDVNYDGNVTVADFLELASNFGSSFSGELLPISVEERSQLDSFAAAHVPEPTSLMVCGILSVGVSLRRKARRTL